MESPLVHKFLAILYRASIELHGEPDRPVSESRYDEMNGLSKSIFAGSKLRDPA